MVETVDPYRKKGTTMGSFRSLFIAGFAFLGAAGCGSMMAALDQAGKGPAANLTGLPPGPGWTCYTASEAAWSGCWRTQGECEEGRKTNREDSNSSGVQFGECTPGIQAACLSYDAMSLNSDGSARYENRVECAPDLRQCKAYGDALKKRAGLMKISECEAVK